MRAAPADFCFHSSTLPLEVVSDKKLRLTPGWTGAGVQTASSV